MALGNLGGLALHRSEWVEARRLFEQVIDHQRDAIATNPDDPANRQPFRGHYGGLGRALLGLGEHAGAARVAEELARMFPDRGDNQYSAACILALCVPLTERNVSRSEEGRWELAKAYADRAMALLREAVRKGFTDGHQMGRDPDLASLRDREDFKERLGGLGARSWPAGQH